ncbi:hypothetical protein B0T17DRAFT_11422 [Bombardia bombarda]|uniref:Uncharacterized protein n=1 Tax=Bombardia bombarda TaxID=252184 RepID=A0AA40CDV6_9PEZI|nr:hypothetical protein B0T17DRAFT_11422 [Bombardia bombarda]
MHTLLINKTVMEYSEVGRSRQAEPPSQPASQPSSPSFPSSIGVGWVVDLKSPGCLSVCLVACPCRSLWLKPPRTTPKPCHAMQQFILPCLSPFVPILVSCQFPRQKSRRPPFLCSPYA